MAASPQFTAHYVTTLSGHRMPRFLYGTAWKKDRTADLVVQAVLAGFRGIDVACQPKHYNEPGVGDALQRLSRDHGVSRDDLFIQTKFTSVDGQDPDTLPYDPRASLAAQVRQSFEASRQNLGVDRIDSLVLHAPMRTWDDTLVVWREFERLVREGGVRQLGISNCYSADTFRRLWEESTVKPAVLQNRFYAETGYDRELRRFCVEKNVGYQSFWTLTANPHVLRSPVLRDMAAREQLDPERLFYRYCLDSRIVVLCGTTNQQRMKADLQVLDSKCLSPEDIAQIETVMGI